MERYNVNYKGKYTCYSEPISNFLTRLMPEKKYRKWIKDAYGKFSLEFEEITMQECIKRMMKYQKIDEITYNLLKTGISIKKIWDLLDEVM